MGTVHDIILAEVERGGEPYILDLVATVGPQVRLDREEVTAAVWDLVHEDRVTYSADGRVRPGGSR